MKLFPGKSFCVIFAVLVSILHGCNNIYTHNISVNKAVIVVPENPDSIKKFAAGELQKHLSLITGQKTEIIESGKKLPDGSFPIYVGITYHDDKNPLQKEEARYRITPDAIYIYGEDTPGEDIFNLRRSRTGTLFAVYFFLENEFGVKWLEPGDWGIVYTPAKKIEFAKKEFSWVPQLKQRMIRGSSGWKKAMQENLPKSMVYNDSELSKKNADQAIWQKRMRMGSCMTLNYGHAFTTWWEKYGKEHPEYFALIQKTGKRAPYDYGSKPDRIKMCVSNKGLQKQIVENWLAARKQNPQAYETINVCENDSAGYCECPECTKLDVSKEGEAFGEHMTDRYIWFSARILEMAREKVPDAKAVMYAYSVYRFPPRREKVPDGLILGFVPDCLRENEKLNADYKEWRAAGAKELFLRPNDMHLDPGLPIGFGRKMFESFKVGIDNGIIGTDYDSLHGFWEISGLGDYALARGNVYPDKNFDYWMNEYCSAFGPAKEEMKEYFKYWENNWQKRIYPDKEKIREAGRYGNFRRGLIWNLADYFKPGDFDATDAILEKALSKSPDGNARKRIEKIKRANRHSRLTLEAIAVFSDKKSSAQERLAIARKLLKFREENRDRIDFCWPLLFGIEKEFGDITGIGWARTFGEKLSPAGNTFLSWRFKIDEKNEGLAGKWQDSKWDKIQKEWAPIVTSRSWENQPQLPTELSGKLKTYDGIGWYAARVKMDKDLKGKKLYLVFGAVDESCWIYVNGKKAGERLFKKDDDWKTPFTIRIDQEFDHSKEWQDIIVRVEDKAGMGGIWKPVWLAEESE